LIIGVSNPTSLRVGTYNVHGGYTEFYAQSLEEIAQTIERSGANVVLLQEVEAGRLTSFGVDQPLWLARRLGMDRRFFPTNEGLQGLAVLSNVPIVFDDGEILPSIGQQTGLQRVQVQPAPDEIVTIYNTWLGLLVVGEDIEQQEADQQRQLDQIVAIIGQHHPDRQLGRTVLGGTFNNVPDSDLIQSIDTRGFSDPFAGSTIERSATLRRTGVNARVDYVWIYPELAEGVGVIDSNASDHRLAFVSVPLQ
jgi:endonuclease/exonuclease/phosphatase family metal-dependent hydrolase